MFFHHDFLVPSGSGLGSGACLPIFFPSRQGFCSILISWFLLVPARLPGFVSPLSFLSFRRKRGDKNSRMADHFPGKMDVAVWGLCWCNLYVE